MSKTPSRTERDKALAEQRSKIERNQREAIATLNTAIGDINTQATAGLAAVEQAAQAREREVFRAFVTHSHDELPAPIDAWCTEPSRALTARVGTKVAALLAREAHDIGLQDEGRFRSVTTDVLGFVFIDRAVKINPGVAFMFADNTEDPHRTPLAAVGLDLLWEHAVQGVLRAFAQPVELEVALREVESVLGKIAQAARDRGKTLPDEVAARWAAMRVLDNVALEAVDRKHAQAKAERIQAESDAIQAKRDRGELPQILASYASRVPKMLSRLMS
jgi:hypothetical protein